MRDPSEVIAEMRRKAIHVADYGMSGMAGKAVIDGWADELSVTLLPASTPPGDACVRHACKRVRMEMQAEIERLRGLLRRWLALDSERDYVLRGETAAEVKGVSHAG